MFLIISRQESLAAAPTPCGEGQTLYLGYGRFFAEFLGDPSLVRLGLLDLTTCVGLWYGLVTLNLRSFSWKALHLNLVYRSTHFADAECNMGGFTYPITLTLATQIQ